MDYPGSFCLCSATMTLLLGTGSATKVLVSIVRIYMMKIKFELSSKQMIT